MSIRQRQDKPGETERLVAIGQRVLNVAHEINHPLTFILMTSSFALAEMKEGDPLKPELETIKEETLHLRSILRNLLDFSRPVQYYLENVDVNACVSDCLRLCEREMLSRGIELRQEWAARSPIVLADKHWLAQVFNNLIVNALDAMPQGGRLTVRTRRGKGEAVVQVIDTGTGIAPADISRLFEPFFTTKRNGRGIGLGLAISRNIVSELGGRIDVTSEPGSGSTFAVRLPLLVTRGEEDPVGCEISNPAQPHETGEGDSRPCHR